MDALESRHKAIAPLEAIATLENHQPLGRPGHRGEKIAVLPRMISFSPRQPISVIVRSAEGPWRQE
jgi:hypothetical protein